MTIGRIYVLPNHPFSLEIKEVFLQAEGAKNIQDVFLGNCEELWVIDLERGAVYMISKDNPKLLKVEVEEEIIVSTKGREE